LIRQFQSLLDACVDAVVIIDHHGIIQNINPAACRLFGYEAGDMIHRNVAMLMPEADARVHDHHIDRYVQTGEAHIIGIGRDVHAQRKDGSWFPVALAIGQLTGADPPRFVGFMHDLTGRHQDIAQRIAAQEAVREARERLTHVARLSTLGEMTTGLAHEINQPLTAIAMYARAAERLATQPNPELEEVVQALQQIASQALRAGEVIRRLRALVRHRHHVEELLDLNAVVRDLVVLAESDARMHNVRLELRLADELPQVLGDTVQLQQVMLNLVRNAIDAVQQVPDQDRVVILGTTRTALGVELSVCDRGAGLDPAIEGRLFEAFATTKPEGTGLGLAISRSIVESHGGKLAWKANSPQGCCFQFHLPAVSGAVT
jgi:two-component system sensor kinase FixL